MKSHNRQLFVFLALLFAACNQPPSPENHRMIESETSKTNWKGVIEDILVHYGHRNWIVIADAAYPQQSNPAIKTIVIDASQLEAVEYVSGLIDKMAHVDGSIFLDRELEYVSENNAEGVGAYRADLSKILDGKSVTTRLHEDIIKELDESAKLFNVLVLKTNLTIPYTSVFFQLECGYWPAESEQMMREAMKEAGIEK